MDNTIEPSFWEKPFAQDILPFITSIIFHIILILIGVLTYQTVSKVVYAIREPIIIPDSYIGDVAVMPTLPETNSKWNLGDLSDMDRIGKGFADGVVVNGSGTDISGILRNTGGSGDGEDLISIGPKTGGFGKGISGNMGTGTDDGKPFGMPDSPYSRSTFATIRVGGNVTRLAYVCDASGSMMNKFDILRTEIIRALDGLKPIQSYNVIFFGEKNVSSEQFLVPALPENKRKTYSFLERTTASGATNPIPALQTAFANKPQLIYLLTDGDFPNNNAVLEEVRRLNADKRVKINTIAFMDKGEEYERVLKQIAQENGGLFKYVSESDLQR